jgi:hypothetical protein
MQIRVQGILTHQQFRDKKLSGSLTTLEDEGAIFCSKFRKTVDMKRSDTSQEI